MENILGFSLDKLPEMAKLSQKKVQQTFERIRKRTPARFDDRVQELHDEAFAKIDCLECGNCCRGLGPRLIDRDIERLAKTQRMRPTAFIEAHLRIDEDGDYIFRQMPCPFLGTDNYCAVYDDRPKACREYPHTDRRRFVQF